MIAVYGRTALAAAIDTEGYAAPASPSSLGCSAASAAGDFAPPDRVRGWSVNLIAPNLFPLGSGTLGQPLTSITCRQRL